MIRSAFILFAIATIGFLGACDDSQIISELEQQSMQSREIGAPISVSTDDATSEETPGGFETQRPDGMTGSGTDRRDIKNVQQIETRKVGEPISTPPKDDHNRDASGDRADFINN